MVLMGVKGLRVSGSSKKGLKVQGIFSKCTGFIKMFRVKPLRDVYGIASYVPTSGEDYLRWEPMWTTKKHIMVCREYIGSM